MKHFFTFLLLSIHFIGATQTATFEELTLAPDTFWDGADLSATGFESGGLYFPTYYNSEFSYWEGGVAYSNVTDSITSGYGNLYASKAGKGANNSSNYAVAYNSGGFKISSNLGYPITYLKLNISNGTYAYNSMRDGDAFAKKFGGVTGNDSDYFYVTFKGFLNGNPKTSAVQHYLADYRFQDNSLDYIQRGWQEIDLGALGDVDSVAFEFSSSDSGEFGINTPLQFCLDNITFATYINGIANNHNSSPFSVFPNPSNGTITLYNPNNTIEKLEILDTAGRVVFSNSSITSNQSINIETLSNGVYFTRFTSLLNSYTNKFILSK
jgi:hypothetical protein